jgi:small-conductance mechanosensitive channel
MCDETGTALTADEGVGFITGGAIAESGAAGVLGTPLSGETIKGFAAGVLGTISNRPKDINMGGI